VNQPDDWAGHLFELRSEPVSALADQADLVASACHAMAVRFHQGGKLIAFGTGVSSTDAQHVAVEFVHPVIVGKRALPAISLTTDIATVTGVAEQNLDEVFAHQIRYLAEPADIALGISTGGISTGGTSTGGNSRPVLRGLEAASALGLLTVALAGGAADKLAASPAVEHLIVARSDDPRIVKELQVTAYHVLWELVHVFFEQPGVLEPGVVL